MSGWGVGIGSFASGLADGFTLGDQMAARRTATKLNQYKIDDLERQKQESEEVLGIGRQAEAEAKAAGVAPEDMGEWYSKNVAPRVYSTYLKLGHLEKAEAWKKHIDDAQTKRLIHTKGVMAGQLSWGLEHDDFGPLEGTFREAYNGLPAKITGGAKFDDFIVERDRLTNQINGLTAVFKNADGKEVSHTWKSVAEFSNTLNGWLDPHKYFEHLQGVEANNAALKKRAAENRQDADADIYQQGQEIGLGIKAPPKDFMKEARDELVERAGAGGKPPTTAEIEKLAVERRASYERVHGISPVARPGSAPPPSQTIRMDPVTGKPVPIQPAPGKPGTKPPPVANSPAAVTSPRPGSAAQAAQPARVPEAVAVAGLSDGPAVPSTVAVDQASPGIGAPMSPQAALQRPVQPQVGPSAAPQYADTGQDVKGSIGGYVSGKSREAWGAIGDAASAVNERLGIGRTLANMPEVRLVREGARAAIGALPAVGNSDVDRINAARRTIGLPPLGESDIARIGAARQSAGGSPGIGVRATASKGDPVYVAGQNAPGLVQKGNIDINSRPVVKNPDGTVSTVRSITITTGNGRAVLLPTVIDGRVVSNDEAIRHFKTTHQHLGVFEDEASANRYAHALHEQQAQASGKGGGRP